ncbi:MAG: hypothetical protein ABIP16_00705 [Thermomonas sp.]
MDIWQRLKQRKLVQWAVAYVAAAFALLQGIDIVAQQFGWPETLQRGITLAMVLGFVVALVLAWYHGERGEQNVSSTELLIVALLLAIGGGLMWRFAGTSDLSRPVTVAASNTAAAASVQPGDVPAKSIAVLPFENLSEDKANGYFADGVQDQILTGLAKLGDLKVISRTSTQRYASRPDNIPEIAKALGVAYILEGSVQKAGDRVRINVQLIRGDSDSHLWAETYDRDLDDIFAVESEVAEKIATSLATNLTGIGRAALVHKPTDNPDAYDAYLKARALNAGTDNTRSTYEKVIVQFRRAVALDPGFAMAWAELAQVQIGMYWYGFDANGDILADAKSNLDRATSLSPQLPQVEMANAVYLYYAKRDFAAALAVMHDVRKNLPGDSEAWFLSGLLERRLGQWEAAAADLEHARTLSPNEPYLNNDVAITLLSMHRFETAAQALDAGLALEVDDPGLLAMRLWAAWNLGGLEAADQLLAKVRLQAASIESFRADQALFRRDYPAASALYRRAIATDDGTQLSSVLLGYVPASLEWRLRLALSEKASGASEVAASMYRELRDIAQRALDQKSDNPNVEGAWRVVLARALAGLGQRDAALAQGLRAVALNPESKDRFEGPTWQSQMATILAMNGDVARAVPLLRHLLSTEGFTTPFVLRMDPVYDPIREDPGFKALLEKSDHHE